MLKAAIEKIAELANPVIQEIEGRTFAITPDGEANEIRPTLDAPCSIRLNSLDSLVKMMKTEALDFYSATPQHPLYITIPTHDTLLCFTQPDETRRYDRLTLYEVKASDVPGWEKETTLKFEEAMIAVRTRFQDTADAAYTLKLLSDITTGSKVTYSDNGIATSVVTKTGVALQTNEAIRPIVTLKPYRTFQEVEQPASQFLIRITERGIAFVEADGGMWKLTARLTIKKFIEEALADEIGAGTVVVAL